MQDWVQGTIRTVSAPLFEPAKNSLKAFLDFTASPAGELAVKKLTGYVQSGVDTLAKAFSDAKVPVMVFLSAFNGVEVDGIKGFDTKLGIIAERLGTLAGKAWEVYQAVSPLNTVIDVFKGLLTGGLQGGLLAFEQHIKDAGNAFGIDLGPALDTVNNFITGTLMPTLQSVGNFFVTDVLPKASSFFNWLGIHVGPIFTSIANTWETILKPALNSFGDYITKDLWPKLRDQVFPWIDANVRPKLETAFNILSETIIPNLGKFVDIVLNHVIPVLVGWWGVLFTLVSPFLKTIGDLIGTLTDKLGLNKDSTGKVMDGYKTLVDVFKKDVLPILEKAAAGFSTLWKVMGGWLVEPIFKTIGALIQLVSSLGEMLDKFSKGDYPGAVQAGLRAAAALGFKSVVINGNGTTPAQQRTDQYAAAHPGYDPVAAGNAPKKALGTTGFSGGPVWWGEGNGWESFQVPGGPTFYSSSPVYSPDAGAGSKITPMGDMAGNGNNVTIHLTVNGNPDQGQLMQMKRVAKDAVKEALTDTRNKSSAIRSSLRPQRAT